MKERRRVKINPTQIQQGDVLIEAAAVPAGVKPLPHRTLREGEHTGHKHVAILETPEVEGADVTLFIDEATGTLYMRVSGSDARVVHEEHNAIALTSQQIVETVPPGEYRIGAVREYDYDADEERFIAD
jgi:hypothetical protein